jgi:hypothetical protein
MTRHVQQSALVKLSPQAQTRLRAVEHDLSSGTPSLEGLQRLQSVLEVEVFGDEPRYMEGRPDVSPTDERLGLLIDSLVAMSALDDEDPSYFWSLGAILFSVGRYFEAGLSFDEAGFRSIRLASSASGLADEDDWAETSFYHAGRSFALSGSALAAIAYTRRLSPRNAAEIRGLVESSRVV